MLDFWFTVSTVYVLRVYWFNWFSGLLVYCFVLYHWFYGPLVSLVYWLNWLSGLLVYCFVLFHWFYGSLVSLVYQFNGLSG